jgi:hypothetical protein
MISLKKLYFTVTISAGGLLSGPGQALACSVCGLDADGGFFWSFLFLASMPFAVAGAVGGVFFFAINRDGQKRPRAIHSVTGSFSEQESGS